MGSRPPARPNSRPPKLAQSLAHSRPPNRLRPKLTAGEVGRADLGGRASEIEIGRELGDRASDIWAGGRAGEFRRGQGSVDSL